MLNIERDNNNFEELNFEEDDMMSTEQRADYESAKLRDLELKTKEESLMVVRLLKITHYNLKEI